MAEVLVLYYSRGGSIARLARQVARGIEEVDGMQARLRSVRLPARSTAATVRVFAPSTGVMVGFHTDDGITDSRLFLRSAALAVRAGMSRDKALYAMTMAGARMLDLEKRVSTLEAGKDADFIILSGDPLALATHVEQTFVEGVKVFDLSSPRDHLFAVGGFQAVRTEPFDHHAGMEGH